VGPTRYGAGDVQAGPDEGRAVGPVEVAVQVVEHVAVGAARRQGIDEAEERDLELGSGDGPVHEHLVDVETAAEAIGGTVPGQLGQVSGQVSNIVVGDGDLTVRHVLNVPSPTP
jgi:hypothetical protein